MIFEIYIKSWHEYYIIINHNICDKFLGNLILLLHDC